jgi:hypothetical protein
LFPLEPLDQHVNAPLGEQEGERQRELSSFFWGCYIVMMDKKMKKNIYSVEIDKTRLFMV